MQSTQRHVPNSVGHFDIAGPDAAVLGGFYGSVFGWELNPRGPGYVLLGTPGGTVNGAVVESQTPGLTLGIVVSSLEQSLKSTVDHGGEVVMPVTDNGWVRKAQIRDPAGNVLTLIEG
jgi:predicted enzyme related to lactoylglutathione lyase